MKIDELMREMVERTGVWNVPEYCKILDAEMIGMGKHQFQVLFYNHPKQETILQITIKELQ